MTTDLIYDKDGVHVARIENGKIYRAIGNEHIADVRNNKVYHIDSEKLICYLQDATNREGDVSEEFRKLIDDPRGPR